MKKVILSLILVTLISGTLFAQRVYPLVSGITVDSVLFTRAGITKMAMEKVSGHLYYSLGNGDIYEVYIPGVGAASDTFRYSSADHGITSLQGLCFRDSVIYLCGNNWASTTTVGKVVKGILQPNGTRVWVDVVTTMPYQSASSTGDHGFTDVSIDPAGNYIYFSSGARTHLGEIRTNNNAWANLREVPLTCHIFRFPINTHGIMLPNDSTFLAGSGYIYASGTRNAYDMAWDGNDTLFAIDNSGERDDPEELNWIRAGKHYGFPWRMGSNNNPLRNPSYDVNTDPLVNHLSSGYINGWFAPDSTFPPVPNSVVFTDPVRNYGVAGDYYRDSVSGHVIHASDSGNYITSFTAHRSPLGLVFDRDSVLAAPFRGDGFILNFMPGGDSAGYTPLSPWGSPCPFVDPSRELIQMKLTYNSSIDNYTMTTTNIVEGFYLPVDAELVNNMLYVIENGGDIWRITFPEYAGIHELLNASPITVFPNPASTILNIHQTQSTQLTQLTNQLLITDLLGNEVYKTILTGIDYTIPISKWNAGVYFYEVRNKESGLQITSSLRGKFVVQK